MHTQYIYGVVSADEHEYAQAIIACRSLRVATARSSNHFQLIYAIEILVMLRLLIFGWFPNHSKHKTGCFWQNENTKEDSSCFGSHQGQKQINSIHLIAQIST